MRMCMTESDAVGLKGLGPARFVPGGRTPWGLGGMPRGGDDALGRDDALGPTGVLWRCCEAWGWGAHHQASGVARAPLPWLCGYAARMALACMALTRIALARMAAYRCTRGTWMALIQACPFVYAALGDTMSQHYPEQYNPAPAAFLVTCRPCRGT